MIGDVTFHMDSFDFWLGCVVILLLTFLLGVMVAK